MRKSKKVTIKICTRPFGISLVRIFKIKHLFIIDESNNIYEFSRDIEFTRRLTKDYLENYPEKVKIKKLRVNKKLFYKVIRIQKRITKRKAYSLSNYNCQTYINSILINLNKF
ncbi:MAG: hypothetical protein QGF74_01615 [Candidatus Nanoarchaeia archaeon]|jgi:hypothetical protein|nr:hypothetical protein [Candidatus Nanoarchaeia archaeon]|tara:strand:- start:22452 stop:22790 length:339 start_codon:yes stop_codon:yes gene_type:complete